MGCEIVTICGLEGDGARGIPSSELGPQQVPGDAVCKKTFAADPVRAAYS